MGFEGGEACQKIWLQRRGQGKNISGEGGGGSPPQKNSFKFCSDDICDNRELNNGIVAVAVIFAFRSIMQTTYQNSKKPAFLMFSLKFIFSPGSTLLDPFLYSTPPK